MIKKKILTVILLFMIGISCTGCVYDEPDIEELNSIIEELEEKTKNLNQKTEY